MAFRACGCGRPRGAIGDLRRRPFLAMVLIFVSAGAGAILRRALARLSTNYFIHVLRRDPRRRYRRGWRSVTILARRWRLVAVCPCMFLVPGAATSSTAPWTLSPAVSIWRRPLVYAGLVVVAISTDCPARSGALGVSLPVDPPGRTVPLWQDVVAAGVAVACYSISSQRS